MPCVWSVSNSILFHHFNACTEIEFLADLSGEELNDIYDKCTWSPPALTEAEEVQNKRSLIAWLQRNLPDFKDVSGRRVPTKSIIDQSMALRNETPEMKDEAPSNTTLDDFDINAFHLALLDAKANASVSNNDNDNDKVIESGNDESAFLDIDSRGSNNDHADLISLYPPLPPKSSSTPPTSPTAGHVIPREDLSEVEELILGQAFRAVERANATDLDGAMDILVHLLGAVLMLKKEQS
ncbi:hypothetical protein CERZMDRAFT_107521 [Cercospora zeae-maydis SCOH1-5]|uniref:Uncharacterized protein n=1 Tax=Cercospora zeae-maydis SCOH1-5 TaxID=717836 RepID=A0A6A6F4R9_9PEZI|nr:hypothetical protein CERZMDRAFT_107521 [Cercospora zeae-maydis SCOH1-5]